MHYALRGIVQVPGIKYIVPSELAASLPVCPMLYAAAKE